MNLLDNADGKAPYKYLVDNIGSHTENIDEFCALKNG